MNNPPTNAAVYKALSEGDKRQVHYAAYMLSQGATRLLGATYRCPHSLMPSNLAGIPDIHTLNYSFRQTLRSAILQVRTLQHLLPDTYPTLPELATMEQQLVNMCQQFTPSDFRLNEEPEHSESSL